MNREIFKSIIPDKGISDYILNSRLVNPMLDPFDNIPNYGTFFNNVINLAFMYAFSCYKDYENRNYNPNKLGVLDECIRGGNANSVRVLSNMKKIYNGYPITNELIQYILLDIYFDFELGEDDSHLRNIFPNFINTTAGIHLDEVFELINKTFGSSRTRKGLKLKEAKNMFAKTLNLFPFMSTTKLVFMPERQWYAFVLDEREKYLGYPKKIVNTFGAITKINNGAKSLYYYLSDMTLVDVSNVMLKYSLVGADEFILCKMAGENTSDNGFSNGELLDPFEIPHDEEYFCSLLAPDRLESIKRVEKDYSIEQLFNIKYKHIKNLALAIADTLGRSSTSDNAQKFKEEFEGDFPQAFKNFDESLNNWDTVVLMLLIETSPSLVIQKLFSLNGIISLSTATTVIKNLKKRFGKGFSEELAERLFNDKEQVYTPQMASKELEEKAKQLVRISTVSHKAQSYNYLQVDFIAEKMAEIVLSAISNPTDNEPVQFCIGNSKQNIEALEALRSLSDDAEKCKGIYDAFGELLIKLTCFYEGIYAYGAVKLTEYDYKAASKMLKTDEIYDFQVNAENAFTAKACETFEEIKGINEQNKILPILKYFVNTCADCYSYDSAKKTFERKDDSYKLYSVLGKNSILNLRLLQEEISDLPELSEQTADFWIDEAIKLIKFFRTGSFTSAKLDIELFLSITPFIASYNKGSYNKDGFHTAMFSLVFNSSDNSHRQREINVLSELNYNMNSKYYCIPNVVTSTDKWWIDPFIIKCQAFDEIFKER